MLAVYHREMKAYFSSFLGYSFIGFFMLVAGYTFAYENIYLQNANFQWFFSSITSVMTILVPILTMRLMAEERKNKTDQLLICAPLSITAMVVGKFLAAISVFMITLLLTLIFPIILSVYAVVSWATILSTYLGFFLLGSCFIAVGLLASSLSENQITAAISSFAALMLLTSLDLITPSISIAWLANALNWISLNARYYNFAIGQLAVSPILYFISFCGVFLFLTIRMVEKRRWSEG